jgi:hypothetical protein
MTYRSQRIDLAADKGDEGRGIGASQETNDSHYDSFAQQLGANHILVRQGGRRTSISKSLERYRVEFQEAIQHIRKAGDQEYLDSTLLNGVG